MYTLVDLCCIYAHIQLMRTTLATISGVQLCSPVIPDGNLKLPHINASNKLLFIALEIGIKEARQHNV